MTNPFLLIALSLSLPLPISSSTFNTLSQGSSLSVGKLEDVLTSPSGVFSAGFYLVGENAYVFAIWFGKPSCSDNCTIVWMANREFPGNGKHSKLLLQEAGNLILTDAESTVWSTDTTSISPTKLYLYENGNLVLRNLDNVILWQSFDSPTDTLLPWQKLTKETQLVSSRSPTNLSSGFYKLFFDNDDILRLLYDGPDVSSTYWPDPWLVWWQVGRSAYNNTRIALLDPLGQFTSSDNFTIQSADYGVVIQRRLTLDCDGNLRLYSREDGSRNWTVSWQALSHPCRIHGICGPNSTCIYDPKFGRKCSCIPGYKMINDTDWSYGCEPEFSNSCGTNDTEFFVRLPHTEFYGFDTGFQTNYTLEMCKELCLASCYCIGLQYKSDFGNGILKCYPKILFMNGHHLPKFQGDIYVKVPKSFSHFSYKRMDTRSGLVCPGGVLKVPLDRVYTKSHVNGIVKSMFLFASALGAVELIGIFFIWLILTIRSREYSYQYKQCYHLAPTGFRRFTYSELAKATRNFSEEIGRGSGGIVYKGKFSDDRVAAIKRLFVTDQGEANFLAEISTIGGLNHMNLIDMWGYCAEGKHRLLVYEYMEHGSLADNLSSTSLDSRKRFQIALGTARGLAYLHEECLEWVLHCDVKPQNILLDANYQPKVSDFGLSKLLNRSGLNNASFSKIRGTRGYVAPEWVFNFPISSKVDVYSYGIVILEMVTGRNPVMAVNNNNSSNLEVEHGRLVTWVREKRNTVGGGGENDSSWINEIIDPKLEGEYDEAKMELLVNLALQCVNEDKDARPSMSKVLEMLLQCENSN